MTHEHKLYANNECVETVTFDDESRTFMTDNPNSTVLDIRTAGLSQSCQETKRQQNCEDSILDMKKKNSYHIIPIPEEGLVLQPGKLYLGRTLEHTDTHGLVPMLEGRSSVGRLGISIHATAGFGDIGFCGYWTLELSCIQPVHIYPGVEIGQVYYDEIKTPGDYYTTYKNGKYQNNTDVQPSMMWMDFEKENAKWLDASGPNEV